MAGRSARQADIPWLAEYDQDHLACIAMPLGGIGTGTVSLGGRGDLRDWEVSDHPAKGFSPPYSFFALYTKTADAKTDLRVLEGQIPPPYDEERGFRFTTCGLPRFRHCSFKAAYPLGQVWLSDPKSPVDVRLDAFNPLIPGDADRSGIPVAVLRYTLINKTRHPVQATVCGSVQNIIGDGLPPNRRPAKINRRKKPSKSSPAQGIAFGVKGLDPRSPAYGTMALATTAPTGVSHRAAWLRPGGANHLRDFWQDLAGDGMLDVRGNNPAHASLAVSVKVPPKSSKSVTFLLTWHFPNRRSWSAREGEPPEIIGNYYAGFYRDAWDVAVKTAAALPDLEADTLAFVRAFCESDLPCAAKEAALFNVSTLRAQTCFRTPDGRFFGWEGCLDEAGCCPGSCTHVWNYEQATAFLFGDLAKTMREVEFLYATDDRGRMGFRVGLPLRRGNWVGRGLAAADGQMGCLMKLYREWRMSGDDEMLRRLWPWARKALEFCWIDNGWDADRDGVMEGCQHTTTDYEYFGPNPLGTVWYLGALRAAEQMARRLGEDEFAAHCRALFDRGSRWVDENLFNGEYYEQQIRPPKSPSAIAPDLLGGMLANLKDPDYQIGSGCLSDQLVGQFMAHVCGLGHLLKRNNVRATLRGVWKHNFKASIGEHPAFFRAFAVNDESALVFGTYPKGEPAVPSFRFPEVWTGCEYAVAAHMIQEGLRTPALRIVQAVRGRYDGRKRNPFDESECGHHYARAMASWALIPALTGFQYSAVDQSMQFARSKGQASWFWSNGYAWGTLRQRPLPDGVEAELSVLHGSVSLKRFALDGLPPVDFQPVRRLRGGRKVAMRIRACYIRRRNSC